MWSGRHCREGGELRWYGHVIRRDEGAGCNSGRERPNNRWMECRGTEDLNIKKLMRQSGTTGQYKSSSPLTQHNKHP
jgi:hypothetical protein